MWMPDRRSSQPLYQQIADDIERRIAYGEFPPGSLLPSERRLAAQLGVNRSTVILAYAELRALGIIESRSGSGTRVSKYKWERRRSIPRTGTGMSRAEASCRTSLFTPIDADGNPALLHSMLPGADGDVRQHAEQQRSQHIMEKAGQ